MKFAVLICFSFVVAILAFEWEVKETTTTNEKPTTTTEKPTTTVPPPPPCICQRWQYLTQCITTTGNTTLDNWLKDHGVSSATEFHSCAKTVIESNPEPTNLLEALEIVGKLIVCGNITYWEPSSSTEPYVPLWKICQGILGIESGSSSASGSGSASASSSSSSSGTASQEAYQCSLEAPVAQQASTNSFPFTYNLTSSNTYTCSNLTVVSVPGGCEICNQTDAATLCEDACKNIYGGALRSSSCVAGPYPQYPTYQNCACSICALDVCPDGAYELNGNCFQYFGDLDSQSSINTNCQLLVNSNYHLPSVQTQAEWTGLMEYLQIPAVGYPAGAPFWTGLTRDSDNDSAWQWYNNGPSISANINSDYAWTANLWASGPPQQPDGQLGGESVPFQITQGQADSCVGYFCAKGVIAVYNSATKSYQLWDDINWQPESPAIEAICQTGILPAYSVDLWTAAYGYPWVPPTTTAAPTTTTKPTTASSIPYCSVPTHNFTHPGGHGGSGSHGSHGSGEHDGSGGSNHYWNCSSTVHAGHTWYYNATHFWNSSHSYPWSCNTTHFWYDNCTYAWNSYSVFHWDFYGFHPEYHFEFHPFYHYGRHFGGFWRCWGGFGLGFGHGWHLNGFAPLGRLAPIEIEGGGGGGGGHEHRH